MNVSVDQLATALAGLTYPARPWQITAWAEHNGAGQTIRDALLNIPSRSYSDAGDIADQVRLNAPGEIAPIRPCHHRRHPKNCRGHGWHFDVEDLAS